MFIAEIMKPLRQGDVDKNCQDILKAGYVNIADSRQKLTHWQSLSNLSSGERSDIETAFYEFMRSALSLVFASGNVDVWTDDFRSQVADFIKLLLPLPETPDVVTRLKIYFERREMADRVAYLISEIGTVMMKNGDGAQTNTGTPGDETQEISCPLDNKSMFLQYLHNHLKDGNWQKLSGCLNQKSAGARRWKLLELEYLQCQCSKETDYAAYEKIHRSVSGQISAVCNAAAGRGGGKISPLSMRSMVKPHITIPPAAERKRGMWETYCMIKNVINRNADCMQMRDSLLHKFNNDKQFSN